MQQDAIIIIGTALIGGLLLNLQKRVPLRRRMLAGWAFLIAGWAMAATERLASMPDTWRAVDLALQLTGIALLLPAATRLLREQGARRS